MDPAEPALIGRGVVGDHIGPGPPRPATRHGPDPLHGPDPGTPATRHGPDPRRSMPPRTGMCDHSFP